MFKTMSENKDRDRGKFQGERALQGRVANWSLGDEPHQPAQTQTAADFAGFSGYALERTKKIPPKPVEVVMGTTPVSYISNNKASFNKPPPGTKKTMPAKSRVESVKTNYEVS